MHAHNAHLAARLASLLLALASLAACERSSDESRHTATAPATILQVPVLWRRVDDAIVVAVDEPILRQSLAKASNEARRSCDDARQRWAVAKPADYGLWAVKWAAPLSHPSPDGATMIEHVWVQPANWSPFRVEGFLLSTPTAALECGRVRGEMVSFPIDELSDWIHFASDAPNAAFEGGYTVRVLEEKYGKTGD